MDIQLTGQLTEFIQDKVRSGRYADASDVVREALRVLERQEEYESPALEAALLEGVRGPHLDYGSDSLARIRQEASALQ